jgi:hypothetical protein
MAALMSSPTPVDELLGISKPWSVTNPGKVIYTIRFYKLESDD